MVQVDLGRARHPGAGPIALLTPAHALAGFARLNTVKTLMLALLGLAAACSGAETGPTATPISAIPIPHGAAGVKYALLDAYPEFFWCDPDHYPVSRGDEQEIALERFPEISQDRAQLGAILERLSITEPAFSDPQKLDIYREHKKLNAVAVSPSGDGETYRFEIRVAEHRGSGEAIAGEIDVYGRITVISTEPTVPTCPICLVADTLIDTPAGRTFVQDLRTGMYVWTELNGERVAVPIVSAHRVDHHGARSQVRIVLDDGRSLTASPGHPVADGRPLGALVAGDLIDGARVIALHRMNADGGATYDVLPAGSTGRYWANGILLRSSLWSER